MLGTLPVGALLLLVLLLLLALLFTGVGSSLAATAIAAESGASSEWDFTT
jgi:membrane protein implicated in regulation of membrane protease activity